ncbi:MAG: hypothetical protein RRZ71_08265 [Clostridia bacterium]
MRMVPTLGRCHRRYIKITNLSKQFTIMLFSLLLFTLSACGVNAPDTPDVLSPVVMVNDVLYYSTGRSIQIDGEVATGYIASTVRETELPAQNDEANIQCLNAQYCIIEEGVAVFINDNWILFEELN